MLEDRQQQVRAKVANLITVANLRYGITLPPIDIRFDLKGRAAGIAGHRNRNYFMRFNTDMMMNEGWDHLINDTVPHELAHIVCFVAPQFGRAHNPGWRRVCRQLGGSGERCHREQVTYAKGRTYVYTTTTGHSVALSEVRHQRVQRGMTYSFRGGHVDRFCAYITQH